jgi:hypothetical protein
LFHLKRDGEKISVNVSLFRFLASPFLLQEPGTAVAKKSMSERNQWYPDGRSTRGDCAEIRLDIAVLGYEDVSKSSETGFGIVPETETVIP